MSNPYSLKEIQLIPQQAAFLVSEKRFCCFIGGIGVGKTLVLLLKAVKWCEEFPNSTCLVVRKEYTDLRDSTLIDFKRYFGSEPNSSRDVDFDNGSKILFRHAGEIGHANLRNMTLDAVFIEQGEELDTDEAFTFLRDRMRGKAHPRGLQQINVIANSNGRNWIWRRWIHEPESDDFYIVMATTFDNEKNLPPKFVADMRAREKSEPRHFARMVMNSFDEEDTDDNVFLSSDLIRSSQLNYAVPNMARFAAGLDVARYGDDKTCLVILAQVGVKKWRMVYMEEKIGWGAPAIVGWVKDVHNTFPFETLAIDDIGVGGGCKDYLEDSNKFNVYGFIANEKPNGESIYPNKKAESLFKLEEYISKDWLQILPDIYLHEELMSVRYYYRGESTKYIVSKDDMRAKGIKSPNKVDALAMAMYYCNEEDFFEVDDIIVPGVTPSKKKFQSYAITDMGV
jgi:phage terminase large subunit